MKIKVQEVKKEFTPITVEITFESLEELQDFTTDVGIKTGYNNYKLYNLLNGLCEKLK